MELLIRKNTIEGIAIRWGFYTFLMLTGFFLFMKVVGIIHVMELRFLNVIFMFAGVFMAIRKTKSSYSDFNYFKGMGAGIITALIASTLFTLFGFLYLKVIDLEFLESIKKYEPLGGLMNEYTAVIQIFIEGSASGVTLSFAIMQWFKTPRADDTQT